MNYKIILISAKNARFAFLIYLDIEKYIILLIYVIRKDIILIFILCRFYSEFKTCYPNLQVLLRKLGPHRSRA